MGQGPPFTTRVLHGDPDPKIVFGGHMVWLWGKLRHSPPRYWTGTLTHMQASVAVWYSGLALGQGPPFITKLLRGDPAPKTVTLGHMLWLWGKVSHSQVRSACSDKFCSVVAG